MTFLDPQTVTANMLINNNAGYNASMDAAAANVQSIYPIAQNQFDQTINNMQTMGPSSGYGTVGGYPSFGEPLGGNLPAGTFNPTSATPNIAVANTSGNRAAAASMGISLRDYLLRYGSGGANPSGTVERGPDLPDLSPGPNPIQDVIGSGGGGIGSDAHYDPAPSLADRTSGGYGTSLPTQPTQLPKEIMRPGGQISPPSVDYETPLGFSGGDNRSKAASLGMSLRDFLVKYGSGGAAVSPREAANMTPNARVASDPNAFTSNPPTGSRDSITGALLRKGQTGSAAMPSAVFGGQQAEDWWRDPRTQGGYNLGATGIYQDPFGGYNSSTAVGPMGLDGRPKPDYQYGGFGYEDPFAQNTIGGG